MEITKLNYITKIKGMRQRGPSWRTLPKSTTFPNELQDYNQFTLLSTILVYPRDSLELPQNSAQDILLQQGAHNIAWVVNPKALLLSLVKQGNQFKWNQTLSEADTKIRIMQKQHAKLQYKSIRQLRDSLLQRGPVQIICHRNQISESGCSEAT